MSSDNRPHTAGKLRIHEGKLKPFPHEELGKEVRQTDKNYARRRSCCIQTKQLVRGFTTITLASL